jgi:hypothetical protein
MAACAVAAAAALPAVAQAAPAAPMPIAPVTQVLTGPILGPANIAQDANWWLFNQNRSHRTARTTLSTFQPLILLPGFFRPLFGWFAHLNIRFCVFGIGVKIGPYGTVSVGRGC